MLTVALTSGVITMALAGMTTWLFHRELERQLDQRLEVETHALLDFHRKHGFAALAEIVALRDRRSGTGDTGYLAGVDEAGRSTAYALFDDRGRLRAGALGTAPPRVGWSEFVHFVRPDGSVGVAQALNSALPGGGQLVIAADRSVIDQMHWTMLKVFAAAYGLMLLLSMMATIGFARVVRRRLHDIELSAEAIMAGDLSRRMIVDGSGSEFDRLSIILNRMLDRLNAVLDNLRQMSGDIAHDLRTPLQRVRHRLEIAQREAADETLRAQIEAIMREIDDVLKLFGALLSISEIEGRSVRAGFAPLDLDNVVADTAELYRPTIENSGRELEFRGIATQILGDRSLLQRVVANLLDNAILHTPPGTRISLEVGQNAHHAILTYRDDGPGIAMADRERVFRRHVRLDESRSTPGHGLGLSLIAAIAAAHDANLAIMPSERGLQLACTFPLYEAGKLAKP